MLPTCDDSERVCVLTHCSGRCRILSEKAHTPGEKTAPEQAGCARIGQGGAWKHSWLEVRHSLAHTLNFQAWPGLGSWTHECSNDDPPCQDLLLVGPQIPLRVLKPASGLSAGASNAHLRLSCNAGVDISQRGRAHAVSLWQLPCCQSPCALDDASMLASVQRFRSRAGAPQMPSALGNPYAGIHAWPEGHHVEASGAMVSLRLAVRMHARRIGAFGCAQGLPAM